LETIIKKKHSKNNLSYFTGVASLIGLEKKYYIDLLTQPVSNADDKHF